MARLPRDVRGKRRTREHVIGDLGSNAVERPVLLCGYTFLRITSDYGYDASAVVFNERGEPNPGWLYFQVKATDHPQRRGDGGIAFRVDRADLVTWLREIVPVILCVYDVAAHVVYYLDVQAHFASVSGFDLFALGETATVHLSQVFTPEAVRSIGDEYVARRQQGPEVGP